MLKRSPYRIRRRDIRALGALLQSFSPRMGDLNTIDLRQTIIDTANQYGVPAGIALSVAMVESGIQQWTASGNLVRSSAGAIGVMQLMTDTAAQLGVDPTDPVANIQGGVSYLAQMFSQFGDWPTALAAYNWGPGNVQKALAAGRQFPAGVQDYATKVLAGASVANSFASIAQPDGSSQDLTTSTTSTSSPNLPLVLGAAAVTIWGVSWLLDQFD